MTALMQGKRGLIMGVANDHSIAWGIAKTLAEHGAALAFTCQGDALGRRVKPLAESVNSNLVMPCDVEDIASVDAVFWRERYLGFYWRCVTTVPGYIQEVVAANAEAESVGSAGLFKLWMSVHDSPQIEHSPSTLRM